MNLDDLARDPYRVSELPAEERKSLIRKLASLILLLECVEPEVVPEGTMTATEVAYLFRQSLDWVYARKDTKFQSARLRNVGKSVRFSRAQVEKLFRQGTGR
jgi:hypothetical protein